MSRRLWIGIALVAVCAGRPLAADTVPDSEIEKLIILGRANKIAPLVMTCTAARVSNGMAIGGLYGAAIQGAVNSPHQFNVSIFSNRGWIAQMAWEAAQRQKTITVSDIPPNMKGPAYYVTVSEKLPSQDSASEAIIPAAISDVSFVARTESQDVSIVPPEPIEREIRTWRNTAGATVDYQALTMRFAASAIQLAPDGPLSLVVTIPEGKRACQFQQSAVAKLVDRKAK